IQRPMQKLQRAIRVLDESRAAFDPVTCVVVRDPVHDGDLRGVDVPADYAAATGLGRVAGDHFLEVADVVGGLLDLALDGRAEGPVTKAEAPPHRIQDGVDPEEQVVADVPQDGEPAGVQDHRVELVAVDDQQAAVIGGDVDEFVRQLHAPYAVD